MLTRTLALNEFFLMIFLSPFRRMPRCKDKFSLGRFLPQLFSSLFTKIYSLDTVQWGTDSFVKETVIVNKQRPATGYTMYTFCTNLQGILYQPAGYSFHSNLLGTVSVPTSRVHNYQPAGYSFYSNLQGTVSIPICRAHILYQPAGYIFCTNLLGNLLPRLL